MHLADQVEWPLYATPTVTPEEFAQQLTQELGLGGEFWPNVAHSIHEQVCLARLNLDNYREAPSLNPEDIPLRNFGEESNWSPSVNMLDVAEMEKRNAVVERTARRLRRQLKLGVFDTPSSSYDSLPQPQRTAGAMMSQYMPPSGGGYPVAYRPPMMQGYPQRYPQQGYPIHQYHQGVMRLQQ